MSALSANANSILILSQSSDHVTVRLFFYQAVAGNQSSNLAVNAESLTFRTQYLDYGNALARFVPTDTIHAANAGSNATGTVCYNTDANTIMVTAISGNTAGFASGDVISGALEGSGTATLTGVTNPRRVLSIDSILWSIQGEANNASVGLECANSSVSDTMFMLSGQGYYGRNELDAPIPPGY